MTKREWAGIAAAITALWPSADLQEATVRAWYEVLRDQEAAPIRKAVMELHVSGRAFPPNAGELHQEAKRAQGPYTGPACTCHVEGLTGCQSTGHAPDFAERQRIRDRACDLVDEAVASGELIDPGRFPGSLGEAIRARLQQHWYWANADAGRAINDAGDAEGKPTKAASRHWHLGEVRARQAVREADLQRVVGQLAGQPAQEEGA